MQGKLIEIFSLQNDDIVNEFDKVIEKEKYACFFATEIKNIQGIKYIGLNLRLNLRLIATPFNKKIRWFLAQETENNGEVATLMIIDRHALEGTPTNKVIQLPIRGKGDIDNTRYSFYGDVDRDSSDLKIINAIRKNSIGDYVISYSNDNVFKITPIKPRAEF